MSWLSSPFYFLRCLECGEGRGGPCRRYSLGLLVEPLHAQSFASAALGDVVLRDQGVISDAVLHVLELELDVEANRIGLGEIPLKE